MMCLTGQWHESNIGIQLKKKLKITVEDYIFIDTLFTNDCDSYLHPSRPLSYLYTRKLKQVNTYKHIIWNPYSYRKVFVKGKLQDFPEWGCKAAHTPQDNFKTFGQVQVTNYLSTTR